MNPVSVSWSHLSRFLKLGPWEDALEHWAKTQGLPVIHFSFLFKPVLRQIFRKEFSEALG